MAGEPEHEHEKYDEQQPHADAELRQRTQPSADPMLMNVPARTGLGLAHAPAGVNGYEQAPISL
jgi:hypothetical protein